MWFLHSGLGFCLFGAWCIRGLNGETRCGQQFIITGCVEIIASIWPSLSKLLTTTGLNFIGGDDDDVTILCVEERGSTKP